MDTWTRTVFLALLSLHFLSMTPCAYSCNHDGPEDCTFATRRPWHQKWRHTFCSWYFGKNFTFSESGPRHNYCVGLSPERMEGKLTSRTACSTQRKTHCLQFLYKFSYDDTADLSVMVMNRGANEALSLLWAMSSSSGWEQAAVPVTTTENFRVIFRAKRRLESWSDSDWVFIDDITYSESPCPSGLIPPNAQPTTTAISTTPAKTTKPTKSTMSSSPTSPKTTQTTLTTVQRGTTYENPRPVSSRSASESADTTVQRLTTSERSDIMAEKAGPDEVGIIVSVIVAVLIVIIAFIVVLLVVFRRKHLHILKNCWGKKQPKEQFHMNAPDNVAYNLDADDPVMNHTQENSDNHRREAGTSSRSQTNHLYANSSSGNSSQPVSVYAIANTPKKARQENAPKSHGKPDTTIYELCNEDATKCTQAAGVEYQNVPSKMPEQEQNGENISSTGAPTVSNVYSLAQTQNENHVYLILEKDPAEESSSVYHVPNTASTALSRGPDTEYNRLNFSQKSGVEAELENCDKKRSEKATGDVYNHLNEGSGDAYSEVHREKKAEVIDSVYSHIK